ncbi:MAG: hypothetical protein ACM37W_23580 [Actinomycetota bacterium]
MSGLYDILAQIQNNPSQYLGQTSLPYLFVFLNGYKMARRDLGLKITPEEQDFYRNFQPWIQQKLKVKTVNSWANIIQLFCIDREAFQYFFELLTEFSQREKVSEPLPLKEYTWESPQASPPIAGDQSFYQLLEKIKAKPALYFGKPSICSLQAFLEGYYWARRELKKPLTEQESKFQEFIAGVRAKFHVETEQTWSSIILFYSSNESNALETFFKLFDEFLQRPTSPTPSPTQSSSSQGNKKQLLSLVENLSEEAIAKVREFAESLGQP